MLDAIKNRFSVREYTNQEITEENMNQILEAARLAPTWKNKQCFEIIVVSDRELQMELGEICRFNPSKTAYENASNLLVFVADPLKSGIRDEKPYYLCDSGIAIQNATLQATELGIGSCWVGVFPEDVLKEKLHVPESLKVVGMLVLGYSDEDQKTRPRRSMEEIIHKNTY